MSTTCSVMRVLVVDDYPDNAWSMALLLRQDCHEVETALNGATALQAARDNQPDVVLLDISMPGMSGLQVARELRRMFQDEVTLIAITATDLMRIARVALTPGSTTTLLNPRIRKS